MGELSWTVSVGELTWTHLADPQKSRFIPWGFFIYGTGPFLYPTSILLIKRQAPVPRSRLQVHDTLTLQTTCICHLSKKRVTHTLHCICRYFWKQVSLLIFVIYIVFFNETSEVFDRFLCGKLSNQKTHSTWKNRHFHWLFKYFCPMKTVGIKQCSSYKGNNSNI